LSNKYDILKKEGGNMERTIEPIRIKNFAIIPKIEGEKLTNSVYLDPQIIDKLTTLTEEESLHIEFEPMKRFSSMKSHIRKVMKGVEKNITVRKTSDGLVCWIETGPKKEQRGGRKKAVEKS
jgi:hypothetical protein